MKKIGLLFMVFAMLLSVVGCSNVNIDSNDTPEKSVNFDLNQYEAHGELSCGLIWVEKTTSSYDQAPQTEFAYLDINGNVKSPWFNSEDYQKNDFSNELLIIKSYVYTPSLCYIYDTEFNELFKGHFCEIANANERGEIFGFQSLDNDETSLVMINKNGSIEFPVADKAFIYQSVENLNNIRYENGYYIIDFRGTLGTLGNLPCYMGVFDENGKCIFEPSEQLKYEVYSVKVISENRFEILFEGSDGNRYTVETDNTGKFLTEPK